MTDAESPLRVELASLEAGLDILLDRESDGRWRSMLDLGRAARVELARELALHERLGFPSLTDFERWCAEVKQVRDAVTEGHPVEEAAGDARRSTTLLAELRAVADRVWGLVDSEVGLLEAFERSLITLVDDPGGELIGAEALASLPVPAPAFVLTADNPRGVRSSDVDNDRRTAELEALLRERGVDVRRVIAGSGHWQERGFLVPGAQLRLEAVLAIAARFSQHSVFRLTAATVEIIRVADGVLLSRRSRRSGGTDAAPAP